ncbi:MAG: hypothetical protein JO054_13470 [Actinobacteria bacterium]|nr:hypothetical protein [Actinomycetota bacterium]MBV9255235.1 hypothetical protein [Actinomycetota bacterium]
MGAAEFVRHKIAYRYFVDPDLRRFDDMLKMYKSPGPRVLCWHESPWMKVAREDPDQRTVGEMLATEFGTDIAALGTGGWHLGVYRALARALVQLPHRPEIVVFPVTLPRSTSVMWHRRPDLRFDNAIRIMDRWCERPRPLVWMHARDLGTREQWRAYLAMPSPSRYSELTVVQQFVDVKTHKAEDAEARRHQLAEIFAFHAGHDPDPDHERMVEMVDAVTLLESTGIRCVLYATPFNVQAGVELHGADFADHVASHVRLAAGLLGKAGAHAQLLDFHDRLEPSDYFHPYYGAEHFRDVGRRALAGWITDAVRNVASFTG